MEKNVPEQLRAGPPYTCGAVVNFFLDAAERDSVEITPMKLQKLLYFAHGWSLAFFDEPLIDAPCEAWKFGPVYSAVYHEYKDFGRHPIPTHYKMTEFDDRDSSMVFSIVTRSIPSQDQKTSNLLSNILRTYGALDALTLSTWTHTEVDDNPWLKARKDKGSVYSVPMSDDDIKEYFLRLRREGGLY
jgi:uncharacterized phage-associated protein